MTKNHKNFYCQIESLQTYAPQSLHKRTHIFKDKCINTIAWMKMNTHSQTELPRVLSEWRWTEIKVEREREILVIEVENEGRTWGTLNGGNTQWQGCSLSSFAPVCSFHSTGESREKRALCFFLFSSTQNSPCAPRSLSLSLPPHRGVEPTVLGYQKSTLTSCPCPLRTLTHTHTHLLIDSLWVTLLGG